MAYKTILMGWKKWKKNIIFSQNLSKRHALSTVIFFKLYFQPCLYSATSDAGNHLLIDQKTGIGFF